MKQRPLKVVAAVKLSNEAIAVLNTAVEFYKITGLESKNELEELYKIWAKRRLRRSKLLDKNSDIHAEFYQE